MVLFCIHMFFDRFASFFVVFTKEDLGPERGCVSASANYARVAFLLPIPCGTIQLPLENCGRISSMGNRFPLGLRSPLLKAGCGLQRPHRKFHSPARQMVGKGRFDLPVTVHQERGVYYLEAAPSASNSSSLLTPSMLAWRLHGWLAEWLAGWPIA